MIRPFALLPQRVFRYLTGGALLAFSASCGPPAPDEAAFRLDATGLEAVTAVLEQSWSVPNRTARVIHATRTESGSARVVVTDAAGRTVHAMDLLSDLTSETSPATPGAWRVRVILTDFSGSLGVGLESAGGGGFDWLGGLPLLAGVLALFGATMVLAYRLLVARPRRAAATDERAIGFAREMAMLGITAASGLAVITAALFIAPIGDSTRSAVIGMLGLVVTAILTLSSTTLVSNAIAGFMLRALRPFRRGDWIRVGDQFGRVTERGVVHTQMQTEDRDYATLPNLDLITTPITVIRRSGTYVSATVSLGYDHHHTRIEELLEQAALESGLEEPVEVRVLELGDFSVTYRVAALFADDLKMLLVAESRLRRCMLDVLHGAGVEIVSPAFHNQRRLTREAHFVPDGGAVFPAPRPAQAVDVIFDEAEQATLQETREELDQIEQSVLEAEQRAAAAPAEDSAMVEAELAALRERRDALRADLERAAAATVEA